MDRRLTALALEYDQAMAAGDTPRAGRVLANLINRLKNMDPATVRAGIDFLKAILGEFGLIAAPTALSAPLSADQLLQPGVMPEANEILAAWSREEIARTKERQDAGEEPDPEAEAADAGDEASTTRKPKHLNKSETKAALGAYAELFMLLFRFIRELRAETP